MKTLLRISALAVAVVALTAASHADPINPVTVSMQSVDANGSSLDILTVDQVTVLGMSVNPAHTPASGAVWTAYQDPITIANTSSYVEQEDAFLFSQVSVNPLVYTNTDIQDAIWSLIGAYPSANLSSNAQALLVTAATDVNLADQGDAEFDTGTGFDSGYLSILVPSVYGVSTDLIVQTREAPVTPTPEPTSLLLLATGLFGFAATFRKHRKALIG